MKIIIKVLFLILTFYSALLSNDKKLKIAISTDMIPYSFVDDDSTVNGLLVDYWKLWAKKNNQQIEFVPYTKKESLEAIKNKDVHIHSGLFKNEDINKYVEFLDPIYISQANIYFSNNLKNEINSIEDIDKKIIGVIDNSYFQSYLEKNHPNVKIKIFNSFSQLYDAVKIGKIDLFLEDSLITWVNLIKDFSFNKVSTLADFEINRWIYAAVKKDDKQLKDLVSKGLKKISIDEIIDLENKWIVKDKFRYFQKNKTFDILNYEERLWLLQNSNITLAIVKGWIRYSYIDSEGKVVGFHLDLIDLMNKNLNINIKHKLYENWSTAFSGAKEAKVDGILGLSWSKQREEFFNYSPSYHFSPYYIIAREEDESVSSLSDFDNKIAVTYKNSITNKIISSKASKTKFIHRNTIEGILKAIKDKKADVAILESAKEIDLEKHGLKIVDSVYTKYSELAIGSAKNKKIVQSIIKKAIDSISEPQMKILKDKWLNNKVVFSKEELNYIKTSRVLKVGIEDWSGIIFTNDGQNIEGIGGELAQKAFKISGLKFEYIKGEWNDLLKRFKEGEIDILPTTIYTKQRDEYGDYTKKYLSMKNYIYVKSNNNSIKSLKDLENKKIAIQEGFGTITLINEIYPDINIIKTKNLEESIQKLLNNEVDALFELQISVQNKMKELLITNLKSVSQNSIKNQGLHIFYKQGDELLGTILDKSLSLIPHNEKNEVISKWLYSFDINKDVNVAFGLGRDPYILDKNFMKGIEYDLVNKILNLNSINIKTKKNMSIEDIKNIFDTDPNIDISVSIKEDSYKNSKTNLFFSDVFMEFENVVVSRTEDNISIQNVQDLAELKNKKILAFLDAYKYLGDEYFNLYNMKNRAENYKEISFQEIQVGSFLKKETDLIVLDKNIFKWFFNILGKDNISNYKFHFIFPNNNAYKVAFKDKNLRDIFNKNLKFIRENGDYEEIFNNYTQGYIRSKVKINSLISLILGKYIFDNELIEAKKIVDIFLDLPYIKKLELFNIHNELLVQGLKDKSNRFILTDTYHFIDNLPQKVGSIKVYFDNKLLKEYENRNEFIPPLEKFESLESFEFIKSIYKQFSYSKDDIQFTKKELDFIKNKKIVTFSEIDWKPLSIVEADKFDGLYFDYIDILEKKTGLSFKFEKSKNWNDVIKKFEDKKIDIIPGLGNISFTFKDALVSKPFTRFKYAIVSTKDGQFLEELSELNGKTLALPKNYSSYNLIKTKYPKIKIVATEDVDEALSKLSKKEVDAFVGHSAVAVHKIKNSYADLKIVGLSEEYFNHHMLIQDQYPELLSILNKAIANISVQEKQDIKDKWVKTEVSTAIDYSILYKTIAIFLLVLIIVLIFTKKLSRVKKEIERRNIKIEETLIDLKEQKSVFETLFNETTDGYSLLKNGKFIDCNSAALKMLECKNKNEFLNLEPHDISPVYQHDGQKSEDKEKIVIAKCIEKGNYRFEWIHRTLSGKDFWVEVVLTKIILNNEDIIHVVWRDIKDKKILEKQILDRNIELENSNGELETSIKNLKQAQEQLIESEKMASLGGLVAGVAHEINTPIGIGLTGATHLNDLTSDIKKDYKSDSMTQESFEEYLDTSEKLVSLVGSNLRKAADLVKSFKQVAVDQSSEEKRTLDLDKYISEILASISSVLKKTNLDVKVNCAEDIRIYCYPGAISQILTNLIVNSSIHGFEENEKGNILIDVSKEDSELKIIYKDDGKGIPSENIAKIFDPFFTTNREKGGSGLGLNIIYNIVTSKLDGKIICTDTNQNGVEFIIYIKV